MSQNVTLILMVRVSPVGSGRGGRVVLPARLSGSALRVNRGSYNGCGGAADQSEDQGRQDEELPHGNPPNRSLASFCF